METPTRGSVLGADPKKEPNIPFQTNMAFFDASEKDEDHIAGAKSCNR